MMTSTDHASVARLTGVLLLTSLASMIASAAIVVPTGLTLNPADPTATLAAVAARPALHLAELGLDVLGWLALIAAGLSMASGAMAASRPTSDGTTGSPLVLLPTGLLAAAGLAGLLHDAGNLAITQLAPHRDDPAVAAVAGAVLLTAKWTVNMAGLLWVAAAATTTMLVSMPAWLRLAGALAALSGLAAVGLPWTTGVEGPSATNEQFGYLLHLPVMIWYGVLAWRGIRRRVTSGGGRVRTGYSASTTGSTSPSS